MNGENGTPPHWQTWDPSAFVKTAFPRLKISPQTLPDTFSDAGFLGSLALTCCLEQRKIALFNGYYPLVGV